MLQVKADQLVDAAFFLAQLRMVAHKVATIQMQKADNRPLTQSERQASALDSYLADLRAECERLSLGFTIKHIDRCVNDDKLTSQSIVSYTQEIFERFRDELSERKIYSLRPSYNAFYEQPLDGWELIVERFGCSFEVEEARKCLALERYTAAVFHLTRITETAVLELQEFLKESDIKAHFGSVIRKLEQFVQKDGYARTPVRLQPYFEFLEQVLTQLHAVKDSWRDRVAHVDTRIIPSDLFTEEMAMGVHDATLLLMKKLMAGLPTK